MPTFKVTFSAVAEVYIDAPTQYEAHQDALDYQTGDLDWEVVLESIEEEEEE